MKADGTDQRKLFTNGSAAYVCGNLTNNAVLDSGPKWSPDCSTISYNSSDPGTATLRPSLEVHRINADGTGDVNLTNAPGIFDAFSAWSPDGTRIVFTSNRDVNFEIYTMDSSDGGNVQRLTSPISGWPTSGLTGAPPRS